MLARHNQCMLLREMFYARLIASVPAILHLCIIRIYVISIIPRQYKINMSAMFMIIKYVLYHIIKIAAYITININTI